MKFVFYIIILVLPLCLKSQPNSPTMPPVTLRLYPYRLADKDNDTTFDYQSSKNIIFLKMPKQVFAKKHLYGAADFFVMIDSNKRIVDLQILEFEFFRKKKLLFSYNYKKETTDKNEQKLKSYLLKIISKIPFRQTKQASKKIHQSYCYISFNL